MIGRSATRLDTAFASEAAFRAWYDATLPRVYAFVLARCGLERSLAEELTQQTYVAALRAHAGFEGRADPVSWLCGIARHKLADHYRRLEREAGRQRVLEIAVVTADPGAAAWSAGEERDRVARALATVPPLQRGALILRYLDGLSVREVGDLLGKREGAVESLLSRGREAFRRAYEEADRG